jgi:hypothetical protein
VARSTSRRGKRARTASTNADCLAWTSGCTARWALWSSSLAVITDRKNSSSCRWATCGSSSSRPRQWFQGAHKLLIYCPLPFQNQLGHLIFLFLMCIRCPVSH